MIPSRYQVDRAKTHHVLKRLSCYFKLCKESGLDFKFLVEFAYPLDQYL